MVRALRVVCDEAELAVDAAVVAARTRWRATKAAGHALTYWQQAIEAVSLPTVAAGGANVIPNLPGFNIRVIPNVRLTWTTKMATFRTDGRVKPFILQEEMPMSIKAVAEGSELEFNENKHRYGVDWSGNVGYGYWQHACLTTFT